METSLVLRVAGSAPMAPMRYPRWAMAVSAKGSGRWAMRCERAKDRVNDPEDKITNSNQIQLNFMTVRGLCVDNWAACFGHWPGINWQ